MHFWKHNMTKILNENVIEVLRPYFESTKLKQLKVVENVNLKGSSI